MLNTSQHILQASRAVLVYDDSPGVCTERPLLVNDATMSSLPNSQQAKAMRQMTADPVAISLNRPHQKSQHSTAVSIKGSAVAYTAAKPRYEKAVLCTQADACTI